MPLPAAAKPVEKPVQASPLSKFGDAAPINKISNTAEPIKKMEKSVSPPLFPRHLQLSFDVYKGINLSKVGLLRHQLDIDGDRYTLAADRQAIGLSILANNEHLVQTSYGKVDEHGLWPDSFTEERIKEKKKQGLEATFDRKAQKLIYSNGSNTALPDDAQDILSFMYQLSQLSMQREIIPLPITDGSQLELSQIEVGVKEEISSPLGNLPVLHLRKMHEQGQPYFEIWLGLEYRLFPVKFRQVDGMGQVTGEYVISDIRAED